MADPTDITPTDPLLLDAIKRPLPTVTEDPAKIAAMERQATAGEDLVKAIADANGVPVDWEDWALWHSYATARSGLDIKDGPWANPSGAAMWCDAMLREFRNRYPKASA